MATTALRAAVATAQPSAYKNLAEALPLPLLNFFQKFPPGSRPQEPPQPQELTLPPNSSLNPKPTPVTKLIALKGQRPTTPVLHPTLDPTYNPFLPWRNPTTQRWRPAMYSMRRQAMICKMAVQHGVEELLPFSEKLSWWKEKKLIEQGGTLVKGTGVGQKVKGKRWERTMKGTLETRREAMRGMPSMIRQWKERGHGKGWKKWPK